MTVFFALASWLNGSSLSTLVCEYLQAAATSWVPFVFYLLAVIVVLILITSDVMRIPLHPIRPRLHLTYNVISYSFMRLHDDLMNMSARGKRLPWCDGPSGREIGSTSLSFFVLWWNLIVMFHIFVSRCIEVGYMSIEFDVGAQRLCPT